MLSAPIDTLDRAWYAVGMGKQEDSLELLRKKNLHDAALLLKEAEDEEERQRWREDLLIQDELQLLKDTMACKDFRLARGQYELRLAQQKEKNKRARRRKP